MYELEGVSLLYFESMNSEFTEFKMKYYFLSSVNMKIGDTYHFVIKDHIMMETSPNTSFHLAYSSFFWAALIFSHHLYLGHIK